MADLFIDLAAPKSSAGSYWGHVFTSEVYVDLAAPAANPANPVVQLIDLGLIQLAVPQSTFTIYRGTVSLEEGGGPVPPQYIDLAAPSANPANPELSVYEWADAAMIPSGMQTLGIWPDTDMPEEVIDALATLGVWNAPAAAKYIDLSAPTPTVGQPLAVLAWNAGDVLPGGIQTLGVWADGVDDATIGNALATLGYWVRDILLKGDVEFIGDAVLTVDGQLSNPTTDVQQGIHFSLRRIGTTSREPRS